MNASFQGNGTDSHSTNKKIMGGKVRAVEKINCTGVLTSVCHDLAWTWASYMEHLHNWNALTIKREQETFTSYLAPLLDLLIHKAKAQPILGSSWSDQASAKNMYSSLLSAMKYNNNKMFLHECLQCTGWIKLLDLKCDISKLLHLQVSKCVP